jgi:hypothetical protein
LQENLLQHLLSVRATSNDPDDEVEDQLAIAVIETIEPEAVAACHAPDQLDRVRG